MATGYAGPALSTFSDAFYKMNNLLRAEREAALVEKLNALRIGEAQQNALLRTRLPEDITSLLGATETREVAPAVPGAMVLGATPPEAVDHPEAAAPNIAGYTPPQPAVTASAPSLRRLSESSPGTLPRLLQTAEGRAAVSAFKPTTDQEFERMAQGKAAVEEARRLQTKARAYAEAGDPVNADFASAAAIDALVRGMSDPERITAAMERSKTFREHGRLLLKEGETRDKERRDVQRYSRAVQGWFRAQTPDQVGSLTAELAGLESPEYQKRGLHLLETLAVKHVGGMLPDAVVRVNQALTQRLAEGLKPGATRPDLTTAWRDILASNPADVGFYVGWAAEHKKALPDELLRLLGFPEPLATNEFAHAARVARSKGYTPEANPQQFYGEMQKTLVELRKATRARDPQTDQEIVRNLTQQQGQLLTHLRSLETSLRTLSGKDEVAMPQQERQAHKDAIKRLRDDIEEAKKDLSWYKKQLAGRDRARPDEEPPPPPPPPAGGSAAPAATDPAAPRDAPMAARKQARDAIVTNLYPGRTWDALTPEEKQKVTDQFNAPAGAK